MAGAPQPMLKRASKAVLPLAAGLGLSAQFLHTLHAYTASNSDYCTVPSQDWSLGNDCLRSGVLWPASLLAVLALALFSAAYRIFVCGCRSTHIDDVVLGRQKVYVRYLRNGFVVRDNRARIGASICLLSIFHLAVYIEWLLHGSGYRREELCFVTVMTESSVLMTLATLVFYARYLRSNRLTYVGIFPWFVPAMGSIQTAVALVEIYFSFFTPKNGSVPFLGAGASSRSRFLLISTAIGAVLLFMHSLVQQGPVFVQPNKESRPRGSSSGLYSPLLDEVSSTDGSDSDEDQTPLSRKPASKDHAPYPITPEYSVSWFSRLTFTWVNEVLRKGSGRQIDISDLYKLSYKDTPVHMWKRYINNRRKGRSLLRTMFITFSPELSLQVVLAMLQSTLRFTGPFFLQRILQSIELFGEGIGGRDGSEDSPARPSKSLRSAYLDAVGLFVFTFITAIFSGQSLWIGRHIGARLKGLLVAELTSKTLSRRSKVSSSNDKDRAGDAGGKSDGDDSDITVTAAADGKIMNLLTADFQRVSEVSAYLSDICAVPLMFILGVWYMYNLLGVSAIVGLSLTAVYYPISRKLFSYLTVVEEKLNEASDERVAIVTELLQGIKTVKLFGWESKFVDMVDAKRKKQLKYIWKILVAWVWVNCASMLFPMLVLASTFTFYVAVLGNRLTAEVAFTSISVFQLVRISFEHFPGYLSWTIGGYVSINRIDSYLNQPQVQALEERVQELSFRSHMSQELEYNTNDNNNDALGFEDADLVWDISNSDRISNLHDAAKIGTPTNDVKKIHVAEQTPLLSIDSQVSTQLPTNCSYSSLSSQADMVSFSLKNINIRFPKGGLSIIAGPTGSGKSSLLSALIGEMSLTHGRILIPTIDAVASAKADIKYRDIIRLSEEGLSIHNIAYVAQEAWLRNATIRENILFGEPYVQSRYEEVIRACALKPDLRILTAGDQTEIGERGVTLSGGQKQRIALARAVYSSHRILLIDDCLSAVDAHTAKHILNECLLSKTDLMKGRTCVLVTHHVSMCLPHCQYIVTILDGRISFEGEPSKLQAQYNLAKVLDGLEDSDSKLKKQRNKRLKKGKGAHDSKTPESGIIENLDKDSSVQVNDTKPEDEYNLERLKEVAMKRGMDPSADLSTLEGTLIDDEERGSGYVKLRVWMTYFRAAGNKWFWAMAVLLIISCRISVISQDYWIRIWVQSEEKNSSTESATITEALSATKLREITMPFLVNLRNLNTSSWFTYLTVYIPGFISGLSTRNQANTTSTTNTAYIYATDTSSSNHSVTYWLAIYVMIGLSSALLRVLQEIFIYRGGLKALKTLHNSLLVSVVHATPRFFDTTPLGRIINRFSRDMQVIDEFAIDAVVWWITDLLTVVSILVIIIAITPMFIIVATLIIVVYTGIAYYYLVSSRELKRLESNTMSPLLSIFGELILGVSSIRAFGLRRYYIKEAINRITTHNMPFYLVWATNRWLTIRIDFAGSVVAFSCALFVLLSIGWLDAGLAGFALSYSLSFSESMLWAVRNYSANELNMNAVERIDQYLEIDQEAPGASKPENAPHQLWPTSGNVEVKNLVIEYVPGVPVLHDLTLSVTHGEKIGVVGRTGAGKSTLSLAFMRFVEAARGSIVLDGVDIANIGLEDLRRNITIIPQDPVLFNGTIRFNLDPFNEYPDEIVWEALKRSHLVHQRGSQTASAANSIHEVGSSVSISSINDNTPEQMSGIFNSLNAEIKENGQNLSLGQRQLVALARALVRRSKLIIMDEATASVDFDTDERIQRTIRGSEFSDSTLFCIAHRLRTIIDYDRILVLDKGRIAEFDTPWNLLQEDGSIFKSMCAKSGEYEYLVKVAKPKDK